MKNSDEKKVFARREVIGATVLGAAYLALPEGCGSGSSGIPDADLADSTATEAGVADAQPEATLVQGAGDCKQTDWTRPISIMKAGIALKGHAYAFTDDRFLDLSMQGNRILLIHPLSGSGYVAMSGVCTHMGCSPAYFAQCVFSIQDGTPQCSVPNSDGTDGGDAGENDDAEEDGSDAETSDAAEDGSDAEEAEASTDGGPDDAAAGSTLRTDILFCPCHQSVFDALTGKALSGPATGSGDLQILDTCVGGGYVVVTIPQNPGAP